MTQLLVYLFFGFAVTCVAAGLLGAWWLILKAAMELMEASLVVATCMEAVLEARRQGRAPIFRAYKWLRRLRGAPVSHD